MSHRFWSKLVTGLQPYTPGEQPRPGSVIKLNTNENPYPPSASITRVLAQFNVDSLRRYPDPESSELVAALASRFHLNKDQVFVGNGSDEVLAHIFQALLKQDLPILFPDISYSFYPVYCGLYEIEFEKVPLTSDFCIDIGDYAKPNGGIILPNPNAPTGIALDLPSLRQLLSANPDSVVVIDEA
ncbi:MAG: histidinol-phosphate aminotransferase, partial [Gammaproteobacteria bacterium]